MEQDYKIDFVLGTDAIQDVCNTTIIAVQRLMVNGYTYMWDIRRAGGTPRTRNVIATHFLQQNLAPYLVWLDRDMIFTPQDVGYLLGDLKQGYHSIGGCYAVRSGQQLASYGLGNGDIELNDEIQEVKYLSTGFSAVTRELLLRLIEELDLPLVNEGQQLESYPFFSEYAYEDPDAGWMWMSEDYSFNELTRRIGVKPYLDTRIWVGHIGTAIYDVRHALYHSNRDKIAGKVKEELEALTKT